MFGPAFQPLWMMMVREEMPAFEKVELPIEWASACPEGQKESKYVGHGIKYYQVKFNPTSDAFA